MSLLPLFYVQSPVLLWSFYSFRSKFGLIWIFVLVLSTVEKYCGTVYWISIYFWIFLMNLFLRLQRVDPTDERTARGKMAAARGEKLILINSSLLKLKIQSWFSFESTMAFFFASFFIHLLCAIMIYNVIFWKKCSVHQFRIAMSADFSSGKDQFGSKFVISVQNGHLKSKFTPHISGL